MKKISRLSMHCKNENTKWYLRATTVGLQCDVTGSNFAFQLA